MIDYQDEVEAILKNKTTTDKEKIKMLCKLIDELKEEIIEALNLEDMEPDDIDENEALFGEGLGLDSIDALELIVLLEKNYGIKVEDPKDGKNIFQSVKTMAEYIQAHQK